MKLVEVFFTVWKDLKNKSCSVASEKKEKVKKNKKSKSFKVNRVSSEIIKPVLRNCLA